MTNEQLHLHHYLPSSRSNGPGIRAVVWMQGCTLGCPGCFNPQTHPAQGGEWISVDSLAQTIFRDAQHLEGVTISGGEPFQQISALTSLLRIIRSASTLSILLFSGYTWKELQRLPGAPEALAYCDVLLAGRYQHQHRQASGLVGSANKTLHFLTTRYHPLDLYTVPEAEVVLEPDGSILLSGIDPVKW